MDPEDVANLNALIAAGRPSPFSPRPMPSDADLLADALETYGQPSPSDPAAEASRRESLGWALMNYRPKGAGQSAPTPLSEDADRQTYQPAGAPFGGPAAAVVAADAASKPDRAAMALDAGEGAADPRPAADARLIPVADVRLANRYPQGMPPNPDAPRPWQGPASPEEQPYVGGFQFGPTAGSDLPSNMSPSDDLAGFIKQRELDPNGRVALKPYGSVEGGTDTIGWGHKIKSGEDFSRGISLDEAERLFEQDLDNARQVVRNSVHAPLTQAQFDALTSLAWNRPAAARDLAADINRGDYATAAQKFAGYNTAKHVPKPGLTERRRSEQDLFLTGIYDDRL